MDRLDVIALFMRVVERGNFSAAARELGLGQPTVSKQIAALEARLGAQLLLRTSRSLTLTEAGQDFYETAVRVTGDLEAIESRLGHGLASPSGLIRVTVAPVFGRLYIVPRLPEFFSRFPGVHIELLVSERTFNLIKEGVDIAIREGNLPDSGLTARRVATSSVITVATPAYLAKHGEPKTPSELNRHSCIAFVHEGATRAWSYKRDRETFVHQPKGSLRTDDAEQIHAAVLAGLGITRAPSWLFAAEVKSGEVQQILCECAPTTLPMSAVYPASRHLSAKVRVFIDFMSDAFANDANLSIPLPVTNAQ